MLGVGAIGLGGPQPGQFAVDRSACPAALEPGEDCAIWVRFDPDTAGAATAILRVDVDVGTLTATVAGGAGVPPPPPPEGHSGWPRPVIGAMSRHDVGAGGGERIVIRGENFSDGTRVLFGDVPAARIRLERFDRITAIVPRQAPGVVAVRVITPAGTSPITKASALTIHPG